MTPADITDRLKVIRNTAEDEFTHDTVDAAIARIAELEATVNRLPRTADGVAIVPGMTVFSTRILEMDGSPGSLHVCDFQTCTMPEDHNEMRSDEWEEVGSNSKILQLCYSTLQATLAAKEAK